MNPPILSSLAWSLVRTWGGRLAGFAIYFQLVRVLAPEDMGLFSAAFAVFVFLEIFADLGMVQAVVQRPQVTPAQLNAVLLLNMLAAVLLTAVLWSAAPLVETLVGIPRLGAVLQVGCLTLLFSSAGFAQEAMARRRFEFRRLAMRTLFSTIVGGAVGVWLAATGHGVWALVVQLLVSSALNAGALWLRPAWSLRVRPDFRGVGQLACFGTHVTGMRLVEYAGTRGVELLIAMLLGPHALGIYAVGTKIHYIFMQLLGLALSDVAQSGYARLAADLDRLRAAYLSSVSAAAMAATPAWVVLSAAAPEIALIAFGPRWTACAQVLGPVALLGALQVLQKFDTAVLNALGRPGLTLMLSAARSLGALLAVWLAHDRGLAAVAMAFVASQLLVAPVNLWLLHRHLKAAWRGWIGCTWLPLFGGCLAWIAMSLARDADAVAHATALVRLLMLASIGGATYLVALAALGRRQLYGLWFDWRALRRPSP